MLENYFWAKGLEKFLIKDLKLTFSQRTNIVNTIVDFLIETFGVEVSNVQKTLAAAATVVLFPGLRFEIGDGTVSKNSTKQRDHVRSSCHWNEAPFYIFIIGTVTW